MEIIASFWIVGVIDMAVRGMFFVSSGALLLTVVGAAAILILAKHKAAQEKNARLFIARNCKSIAISLFCFGFLFLALNAIANDTRGIIGAFLLLAAGIILSIVALVLFGREQRARAKADEGMNKDELGYLEVIPSSQPDDES